MNEEINDMVGDLIDQLQTTNREARQVKKESNPIKKENLEEYVIQKSGSLVEGTLDMIETVKDYIVSAPESKDVSSLAELINAATNAVETLNKIVLSTKKSDTALQIKEMDITSKRELQEVDSEVRLKLTREEVFKTLLSDSKPIEAEIIENKRIEE